jgi:hypothetical protein
MAKNYHKNARKITKEELEMIRQNISELGDISGIVHDLNSDEIIGGNQRSKVINFDKCEITFTEKFKKPDQWGTVAWGYVIWEGQRLSYRQVRWTKEQCEKANITANSLTGTWDEDMLKGDSWKDVPGIENWNLPFLLELPPLLANDIQNIAHTSNKYHDVKPLIFISFNLVQRQINVPEEEAKQFLNGIIELTKRGEALQEFYNDVYHLAFDHMQETLNSK